MRMWNKELSFAAKLGVQNVTATLENSSLFLTELNIALLYHVAIVLLSVSNQVSGALSTCEYLYQLNHNFKEAIVEDEW